MRILLPRDADWHNGVILERLPEEVGHFLTSGNHAVIHAIFAGRAHDITVVYRVTTSWMVRERQQRGESHANLLGAISSGYRSSILVLPRNDLRLYTWVRGVDNEPDIEAVLDTHQISVEADVCGQGIDDAVFRRLQVIKERHHYLLWEWWWKDIRVEVLSN